MIPYFDVFRTVTNDEIDSQMHVHNLQYLQWALWAASEHSAAIGWDAKTALADGLAWVVRKHEITYRAAAFDRDEITIRTWISDIDRYAAIRKFAICRPKDKVVLARGETRWVYVDLNVHRALAIPSPVLANMSVCLTPPLPWGEE